MPRQTIRRIRFTHCKRGPDTCPQCREQNTETICLLEIVPQNERGMQHRLIQVEIDGESVWREFTVVRSFVQESEAAAYAEAKNITDIIL